MTKEITDYKLVGSPTTEDLNTQVTELISLGYQPYRAPFLNAGGRVLQAMVKYKPNNVYISQCQN